VDPLGEPQAVTKMTTPPGSAASATNIAPAPVLAIKPMNADVVGMLGVAPVMPATLLGPTRNWVIPPRPKPGRKPATDTPPTKRKAQNRAAQRAFRERRAARVGELEEQLKETEEERQKRESEMHQLIDHQRDVISKLEIEVQRLRDETTAWRDRYAELQRSFDKEKDEKNLLSTEIHYLRHGIQATGTDAVPLPPRRKQRQQNPPTVPSVLNQQSTSSLNIGTMPQDEEPIGCGGCTPSSNCACVEAAISMAVGCGKCSLIGDCVCLDETLKAPLPEARLPDLKRTMSIDQAPYSTKRTRPSTDYDTPREVDFTAQFAQNRAAQASVAMSIEQSISTVPAESCGFCADGTYCACAEANRLAPLLHEVTPPPSESDVTSPDGMSYKLPPLHPTRIHHPLEDGKGYSASIPRLQSLQQAPVTQSPCANGPGSCKQCQEDPRAGLFCRSLAAMRAAGGDTSGGCCGGGGRAGGCCKDQDSRPAVSLSCAETYNTLKTHKNFNQASENIDEWLPKLQTTMSRYPGRAPLDIEAASVMNVIKYFDVRFGRDDKPGQGLN
jgi:hypothetical protein